MSSPLPSFWPSSTALKFKLWASRTVGSDPGSAGALPLPGPAPAHRAAHPRARRCSFMVCQKCTKVGPHAPRHSTPLTRARPAQKLSKVAAPDPFTASTSSSRKIGENKLAKPKFKVRPPFVLLPSPPDVREAVRAQVQGLQADRHAERRQVLPRCAPPPSLEVVADCEKGARTRRACARYAARASWTRPCTPCRPSDVWAIDTTPSLYVLVMRSLFPAVLV